MSIFWQNNLNTKFSSKSESASYRSNFLLQLYSLLTTNYLLSEIVEHITLFKSYILSMFGAKSSTSYPSVHRFCYFKNQKIQIVQNYCVYSFIVLFEKKILILYELSKEKLNHQNPVYIAKSLLIMMINHSVCDTLFFEPFK